jgi:nitric oxide reductase NorD protein
MPAQGLSSARLVSALHDRPGLDALSRQAWETLAADGDAAERWAEAMLALLHANAGAACLTAMFRLRGGAADLASVARHTADICRHAGGAAAIACLDAWGRLGEPGLWPGLHRLARDAPECVVTAAGNAAAILQAIGPDSFADFVALGLKGAGRDKARRIAFFALTDPLARRALTLGGGSGFAANERRLKLFGTALWGWVPALRTLPAIAGRPPPRRTRLSDGVVLLPEAFPGVPPVAQAPLFRAAVAHAVAHLMAGGLIGLDGRPGFVETRGCVPEEDQPHDGHEIFIGGQIRIGAEAIRELPEIGLEFLDADEVVSTHCFGVSVVSS